MGTVWTIASGSELGTQHNFLWKGSSEWKGSWVRARARQGLQIEALYARVRGPRTPFTLKTSFKGNCVTLRTLASGSDLGTLWMLATASEWEPFESSLLGFKFILLLSAFKIDSILTRSDGRSLLERSLPVVSVLRRGWETSTQGWSCVFAGVLMRRTQDWWCSSDGNIAQERSLPVVSVLTGSDGRSLLEHYLS